MTKVLVNPNYLLNVAFRDYKRYDSNEGELDAINGDTYKVLISMFDIRNCKHSIERITVPAKFAKLIDAEEIKVDYSFGQARNEAKYGENKAVVYMLAKAGDTELYVEVPTDAEDYDDLDDSEEEALMAEIRKQARDAGLDEKLLNFGI